MDDFGDFLMRLLPRRTFLAALFAGLTGLLLAAAPASAQVTAFRQAVAESVASEDGVAAFYRGRDFQGIWSGTSAEAVARRNALSWLPHYDAELGAMIAPALPGPFINPPVVLRGVALMDDATLFDADFSYREGTHMGRMLPGIGR